MLQSFGKIFDKCNLEMRLPTLHNFGFIWDGTSWSGFPELVPTLLKLELVKNVGCLTLYVAKLLLFWLVR